MNRVAFVRIMRKACPNVSLMDGITMATALYNVLTRDPKVLEAFQNWNSDKK